MNESKLTQTDTIVNIDRKLINGRKLMCINNDIAEICKLQSICTENSHFYVLLDTIVAVADPGRGLRGFEPSIFPDDQCF